MRQSKRFHEWIDIKQNLHYNARTPHIKEGEVWWCSCGENVGIEINGKSGRFTRPILILTKLSRYGFMGIPLTSQPKSGSWYKEVLFLGKKQYVAICQARVMSVSRLHTKMGQLPESELISARQAFHKLYK